MSWWPEPMDEPTPSGREPEPIAVESVEDLVALAELTEVRTYLLHGERASRAEVVDARMSVMGKCEQSWLETRCRLTLGTEDSDLVVDRSAVFTFDRPVAPREDIVRQFVERVGVMSVYPYLREGASTLASQLGVAPPVLALMRAGTFKLTLATDQAAEPPVEVKKSRSRKARP